MSGGSFCVKRRRLKRSLQKSVQSPKPVVRIEYMVSRCQHSKPKTLFLNEVVPGERYVVVLTNFLGGPLVRYAMGDVVTVTSLRNEKLDINLPQITMYGRASDVIDFVAFTPTFFTEKMIWQAINDAGGVQCGFCTPGVLISAYALLQRSPNPGDDEIQEALVGNLCRCTGYVRIIDGIKQAARV